MKAIPAIEAIELAGSYDGYIFSQKCSFPLGIKTADCLPVFILGKKGMSFIHAGWKGLKNGILKKDSLIDLSPEYAFIGPHIGPCHFEVQSDFKNQFKNTDHFSFRNNKIFFDLKKEAISQLKSMNPDIKIEDAGLCTHCQVELNSFRQNGGSERNWNLWSATPLP